MKSDVRPQNKKRKKAIIRETLRAGGILGDGQVATATWTPRFLAGAV